jgi:hypothetical protein
MVGPPQVWRYGHTLAAVTPGRHLYGSGNRADEEVRILRSQVRRVAHVKTVPRATEMLIQR